jgi:hypothetical protein
MISARAGTGGAVTRAAPLNCFTPIRFAELVHFYQDANLVFRRLYINITSWGGGGEITVAERNKF